MEPPKALLVLCDWKGNAENASVPPTAKLVAVPAPVGISCRASSVLDLLGPGTKADADPGLGKGL